MPKVLITGGAGFLGSHICELFVSKGWQVKAYDNLTKFELARTNYNIEVARDYNVNFLKSIGVELIVNDIRCKRRLAYEARDCNYIINCAAQPAMTVGLEDPHYDADVNIMGSLNVLEVARDLNIPAAICSTIHIYGNGDNECLESLLERPYAYSELDDVLTGQSTPLHASKLSGEILAKSFIDSYQSKIFIARLTGIYGERQTGSEDHGWVANFTIRTLLDRPIKVFGTDRQVRDILYVKDAAQAFLDWYEHDQISGVYNIGGGLPCLTSIRECLQKLSEIIGKKQNISLEPARKGDLWYFCCDINKATSTFGWKPKVLPNEGLIKLVDWVKENEGLFKKC